MSTAGPGRATRPVGRGRAFRAAWSLAAGTGVGPRPGIVVALVAAALVMAIEVRSPLGGSRRFGHGAGPWIVAFAYPSWLLVTLARREMARRAGRRRRRPRGGDVWWRDREWPPSGVEQRISSAIRGPTALMTFVVLGILTYCASTLSTLGRISARWWDPSASGVPELWGWVRAPTAMVVAAWSLPLLWLLVVALPRLGRGRLVVAWPTFPQFTGNRCSFHIGTSPGGTTIDGVRVFLRCIRVRRKLLLPLDVWNSRLVWVAEARLPLSARCGPESHLRAEFDVPSNLPSTDLHAADAIRWEVLVVGIVGVADYADSVVVPIYAATP